MARTRFVALVIVLLGLGYLWGAWQIKESATYAAIGPRFFPIAIAIGIVISGLWLFAVPGAVAAANALLVPKLDWLRLAGILLLMVLYLFSFRTVGFLLASVVLLFVGSQLMGERRHLMRDALSAILLATATSFVFTRLLGINLPTGLLGW
jgi:putative tricarboxylic transport membrane protein